MWQGIESIPHPPSSSDDLCLLSWLYPSSMVTKVNVGYEDWVPAALMERPAEWGPAATAGRHQQDGRQAEQAISQGRSAILAPRHWSKFGKAAQSLLYIKLSTQHCLKSNFFQCQKVRYLSLTCLWHVDNKEKLFVIKQGLFFFAISQCRFLCVINCGKGCSCDGVCD